jgi:catechol 2,3-dioxygenase-like lactoylglutathione lyase family enzyme
MSVDLNHTIVFARDRQESAEFLAGILGLTVGAAWGPFLPLATTNGVTLDFATAETVAPQHYAFLVPEESFDGVLTRIIDKGLTYWADPMMKQPGQINHNHGGRGVYFLDPSGHGMEVITRPYDSHQPA